jgi:DNA invertase Pin-like site-specific DNA recombinase
MPEAIDQQRTAALFIRTRSVPYDPEQVKLSIEFQRRQCHQVADKLGATVIGETVVVGGARDRVTRDTIQAICDQVASHSVDYVITTGIDRLTRNAAEAASIVKAIDATGAQLVVDGKPVTSESVAMFTFRPSERNLG